MSNEFNMRDVIRSWIPPWMSDRVGKGFVNGFKYLYGHAQTADLVIQMALEAAWSHFPSFAPSAALPHIGRDRKIRRVPHEAEDAYRQRLIEWLDAAKKRGSATQLLRDLQTYAAPATPTIRIVTASSLWWTLHPDGTITKYSTAGVYTWLWDLRFDHWDRFWVILYASDFGWTRDGVWGDGSELWGDDPGATWGSTARLEEVQGIRQIVRDNMAADQVCPRIIVCFDNTMFNPTDTPVVPLPDGTWGRWAKDGGGTNMVAARDPGAIYWRGPTQ